MVRRLHRRDPGPCPVDDAPHTTCCGTGTDAIVVEQLPATAAARQKVVVMAPLKAEIIQATLPPGSFTTGTYRRAKRKP